MPIPHNTAATIPTPRADSVISSWSLNTATPPSGDPPSFFGIGFYVEEDQQGSCHAVLPGAVLGSSFHWLFGGGKERMPNRYPVEAVLRDGRRLLVRPFTENDV